MNNSQETFLSHLKKSILDNTFVKLTLADQQGADSGLRKVLVKLVSLARGEELSFVYRHATKDVTKNLPIAAGLARIAGLLGSDFAQGYLFTTTQNLELVRKPGKAPRLIRTKATHKTPPPREHNRAKQRFIVPGNAPYLALLGVTTKDGVVRRGMEAKYRQINKFVEIVAGLLRGSPLRDAGTLTVADMGCGKGYLTFALYDYLANTLHKHVHMTGVEARAELVDLCNSVADKVGYGNLRFECGTIQSRAPAKTDVLIALHACNTATDEALFQAIKHQVPLVVCAPCCHQELRPQFRCTVAGLDRALKFGILLERQAELVTDGLRALLLEAFGYKTAVFEFIATEHTSKNTMIAATKAATSGDRADMLRQFAALKNAFGIRSQFLESLLRAEGILES